MLPLLEIEKVNQKNVIKTQKVQSDNESQSEGFAEILNFISLDKNSKKTEIKSKEIPVPKAQEDSKKDFEGLESLKDEKTQSNILKSLDEKYNLSKKFLDSQKMESQDKNLQAKMQNAQKVSLPTTTLNSAKDLLEYSKAQKQEAKTLKDLGEVAESLKLNLQKISAQTGEEQNKAPRNLLKQEVLPKNLRESLDIKENIKTITQKSTKESPNILSSLLQDKELIKKADKTSKINQSKTEESKEAKTTNKDSNVKIQGETKEEKNLKESKEVKEVKIAESQSKEKQDSNKTSKINQSKTEESKEAKTTNKDSNVKIQGETKEEKNLKESKEVKEVKIVESQSKEKQDSNKTSKINQSKTEESKEAKTTNKDSNVKIQGETKEEKNLKESKEVKEVKIVESQSKEKQDSNKKVKKQENLTKNSEPKERVEQSAKEQSLKVESSQNKTLQEPSKQEFIKESLKESNKEFIKKEEITQEKESLQTPKEVTNKESQSSKTSQKVVQDSMQNTFVFKEKKEIKDSLLKDEKADNKNTRGLRDSVITSASSFTASLKEENVKREMGQQDIFLDNLLKTTEKSVQLSKESLKEIAQEGIKENAEKKAKANQEIYQSSTQAQVENRLSVQNTFLHFSDKLRDALQNYRSPVTKLSLELNPENLGSVELTIVKRGDKLSVQISSNQNALQLFMQNVQEFKNSLNNLGFQDVNLDFKDDTGNSLGSGDFGGSSGGEQGSFGGQNQRNPDSQGQNLEQDFNENPKNTQSWNENSLHIYKEVNNPYTKVALVEINFSYYA